MRICPHSSAVSPTAGTGAAPCQRPTRCSDTSHSTTPTAIPLSPTASPGATHIHPSSGTHRPSHIEPVTTMPTTTDLPIESPTHAPSAWDGAAITPHGLLTIATTQTHGMPYTAAVTNINALGAVTFHIDPAAAAATATATAAAVINTTAIATMTRTRGAIMSHGIPAWATAH